MNQSPHSNSGRQDHGKSNGDTQNVSSASGSKLALPEGGLARLKHFTWGWYCLPMATGGMSLLLSPDTQAHTFPGLNTIGKVIYIFDLMIFLGVTSAISYRFMRWPHTFRQSLTHPTESLLLATSLLSLASIIAAIAHYGIPSSGSWLIVTYRVLFWIYFAVTAVHAVGQYTLLFTSPALKIQDMTPAWDLPIFPFMLSGTIAAAGSAQQPSSQAVPMIMAGLTAQGLGFIISILMYASYIRRMVQFGFPGPNARPAMFIAVGPPSFTALAIVSLANDFPRHYKNYFVVAGSTLSVDASMDVTIQILKVLATCAAVFIWSLSAWFFCIALTAVILGAKEMSFHLNWWAFVFPNVGFTIATITIGKMFESPGVTWVGTGMTLILVVVWLFVAVNHVRAVWTRKILWEGKDEDVYFESRQIKTEKAARSQAVNRDAEKQD